MFNDISNLDDFLFNLQFRCGVQLVPRESVIIFDEVQNCPLARQAIRKLVSDNLSADLGYVYENVVAQMLKAAGNELYYHTWPTESGKHNYEIDFLLSRGNKICPIEVRSSGYRAHASLDAFQRKFPDRILHRYLVYTKDYRKDADIQMLPVFLTMFL